MKSLQRLAALMLLLTVSASAADEKDKEAPAAKAQKPSLTYYYFDGWVLCSKITVIVNDQKKKHSKDLDIETVKVGSGDSAKEIKDAKLKSHGIIAKDKDGKIVTTVDGHTFGQAKVEEVIKKLLPKEKEDAEEKKKKDAA